MDTKPCAVTPGHSRTLHMIIGGKCRECVGHGHQIEATQEPWGNRWTCTCCGRTYFWSIGD